MMSKCRSLVPEHMSLGLPTESLHKVRVRILLSQDLLSVGGLLEGVLVAQSALVSHYAGKLPLRVHLSAHLEEWNDYGSRLSTPI
jgi:hypothetical protein